MKLSNTKSAKVAASIVLLVGSCNAFPVIPSAHSRLSRPMIRSANSEYPEYYSSSAATTQPPSFEFESSSLSSSTTEELKPFVLSDMTDDEIFDLQAQRDQDEQDRERIQLTNTVLRALHNSFKNVEGTANGLLEDAPVLALAIFVGAGLVTAYVLGLFILDGCMESWNPVQNGFVPYWDDEVLVMMKKVH